MFLRKYLEGAKVESATQRGFDRILDIVFSSKQGTFTLVVELLHPGNMLLLDAQGRIINLLENQQYKDRQLRAHQQYAPPPAAYDVVKATEAEIGARITASTRDSVVTTLAIALGLGGAYAEEACARAGIEKHRSDLRKAETEKVAGAVKELLEQPILAHRDGKRAYPFALKSRDVAPCGESSFLHALSAFLPEEKHDVEERKATETAKTRLQKMVDAQRSQVTRFERELVYEQYTLLKEILDRVQHARKGKKDVTEALRRFPQVKGYRDATGEVEVELE
jgi:predicted ribosome quality control (RQC) complex YloA/Tae2 family protein